jgi:CMP-N-acetylneuraminic acid synthetase
VKHHIVALVPMRHQSERVPGKNYRLLAGKPLYHYIILSLLACPLVSEIVIDTDSHFIREDAQKHFPEILLIKRPKHLTSGTVPMNEILLYDMNCVKADYYLQTHSTNPLLRPETIKRAIDTFLNIYPANDSLFSVTRLHSRLWSSLGSPINHDPENLLRTQDLPHLFEENSCLYIFSRETIKARKNRIGKRPFMFEIDRLEACDIDEELDFLITEFLYKKLKCEEKDSNVAENSVNSALHVADN